ncbi:MAG: peptidoglycan DD-metalloendopeptidase family protein [Bacteroidales bacterium]|nr:peptidoglycan DD-metalloendopeptidase family protein [Bacteroidales bacterium]
MMVLRKVISLFCLCLCLGAGFAAYGQNVKEKESRKARLEKEIALLDKQIKDNAAKNADALSRLSLVRSKISTRQSLLEESDREIAVLEDSIAVRQKQIDVLQSRLDTMITYGSRLVKSAYKNRDARIWYMYILASDNVAQGFRRMGFFKNLSSQMTVQAAKIRASKAELEKEKAAMEVLAANARTLKAQRMADMQKLKSEEKEAQNLSASLTKQKAKYQKDLAAKRRQADALEREIRAAINKAMASSKASSSKGSKKGSSSSKSRTPVDYKLADQFVANRGILPWPVSGALTGRFGKQYHPVFKNLQLPANNGINVAVSPDAPVKAVFNGTVAQITVLPGYHQCILVQHGNYFTLYAKMKRVDVKAGDKVKTEQVLGTVDTIAGETVFHFEIWDDRTIPQNPEIWLRPR